MGRAIYVSSVNGDDANSGYAPEKAFRSLRKVNQMEIQPGDQILLEAVTAENPPVSDDIPLTRGFFCSNLFISPAVSEYFPYCPRRRW